MASEVNNSSLREEIARMSKLTLGTMLLLLTTAGGLANAQPTNLLQNPKADLNAQDWQAIGQAYVEEVGGGPCFVVRDGGYFFQDVTLPEKTDGQYLALGGRGSSERINAGGAITGLPYLYAYMLPPINDGDGSVLAYLQGRKMLGSSAEANKWVEMWGVFKIPKGAGRVRFFLNQALRQGVAHDGSAARFDDLGLYILPTEDAAKAFVSQHD
jgi:hypothetical protein